MSAAARSSAASRVDEAEEEEEDDDGADSQEEGGESHFYRAARGAQPDRMETSDDEKSEDVTTRAASRQPRQRLGTVATSKGKWLVVGVWSLVFGELWPPQKASGDLGKDTVGIPMGRVSMYCTLGAMWTSVHI